MSIYFKQNPWGHFCLIEKDLISNTINKHNYWEPHLIYFYEKMIKPGDLVVDAGANIGFHTVQFAKLTTDKGKVISFEPQPLIYNVLTTNILLNNLTSIVEQHKLGLCDKATLRRMTPLSDQIFSEGCINYGGRGISNEGEEEVNTVLIDDFNFKRLDFLKMDIQGSELEALNGGLNTINKFKPIIFLENYKDNTKDQQAMNFLLELGYTCRRLIGNHNEDCILLDDKKHKEEKEIIINNQHFEYEENNILSTK